jgi:hypothetical protein
MSPPETVGFFVIGTNFMQLDFQKMDGLVAAVIQIGKRARPDGRLHERGSLPQDRRDR